MLHMEVTDVFLLILFFTYSGVFPSLVQDMLHMEVNSVFLIISFLTCIGGRHVVHSSSGPLLYVFGFEPCRLRRTRTVD
jgi:predicted membrane metal-binding protein